MSDSPRICSVLVYQTSPESFVDSGTLASARTRLGRLFPGIPLFVAGPGAEEAVSAAGGGWEVAPDHQTNLFAALSAVLENTANHDQDSAAIFRDWPALLDGDLAGEMQADHFRFLAHYTYCDNVPPGLLPDLASLEFTRAVAAEELGSTDLRDFVFKNVNRFDVEIFYRLPDLRQFRLDLSTATRRSRALAATVLERKPDLVFGDLEDFVRSNPECLRPYPSYLEIELSRATPCRPVFLPRPEDFDGPEPAAAPEPATRVALDGVDGPHLDLVLLDRLLEDVGGNSLGDVSIALGGPGEPLRHPEFFAALERCLAHPGVPRVYLETFAYDWTPETTQAVLSLPHADKLVVIVRLATLQAERYRTLYGIDGLGRVLETIAQLEAQEALPFALYVEMPRLAATADELDAFFERFAESRFEVLPAKFNGYAGRLPEQRDADLTPLYRDFCWHLARDLYLNAEGFVTFCKQDPFGRRGAPAWDLRETGVSDVLQATAEAFAASVAGRHDVLPVPCRACDEWYTFNA